MTGPAAPPEGEARCRSICFVTCRRWPEISESDRLVQAALERRGATVVGRAWNDPAASFGGFDAVVLRSNWDYHFAPDDFLAWLDRWERAGARIWNPPALVCWNLTKAYLLELGRAGLDVADTVLLDAPAALPAAMADRGWATAVVKPLVSASGHDTRLVSRADAGAAVEALASGQMRWPAIAQAFVPEIRTAGEWSLIAIEGTVTHAALKRPARGDFRVQGSYGGTSAAAEPPAAALAAARRVLAALPAPALYARIDGVETARGFVLMEVEVNEPGLFFPLAPAAAERFAEAILERVGAGRGPARR
jgi:glutathione synthase/RimK-type ligase-like ATP-grasp enzyme